MESAAPTPHVVQHSALLNLPLEVLHQVFMHLDVLSLAASARVCRQMYTSAADELLWSRLLAECIPEVDYPAKPYPSPTYRDLYISHHPYWFVPKNRIWISDDPYMGKVILCRYDPRRGCIEGYRLLAERGPSQWSEWEHDRSVRIDTFEPKVRLWLDDPILTLSHDAGLSKSKQGWWEGEMKMSVGRPGHSTNASFFLTKSIVDHPSMEVWPPRTIPRMPRVRNLSQDKFKSKGHKPQTFNEICTTAFRMRNWVQFVSGMARFGVRIDEQVSTWSTLDPALYMPTPEKPYQGIYVGDYAGHGCEFLLVMQTDRAPPPPESPLDSIFQNGLIPVEELQQAAEQRHQGELQMAQPPSQSRFQTFPPDAAARDDERIFTGALEAVKLTGDPNVPRGEHTFIADDIGPKGFVRIATESPFQGARVVRSRGHVAARGFMHHEFIPSQLLMINHDHLAQYWLPFGHISFYQRVNLDEVMNNAFHG